MSPIKVSSSPIPPPAGWTGTANTDAKRTASDPLAVQHGGSHYKSLAIQPAEYNQRNGIAFCEASAIKYLTRHKEKGGAEDLKKALHFVQLALSMEYGVRSEVVYHEPGEGRGG